MANYTNNPRLSNTFSEALCFAAKFHSNQIRKDKEEIPYLAHLLAVSSLVLEAGGDEIAVCGSLLHDIVEDTNCSIQTIEECFGGDVSLIVQELSEDKSLDKADRKMLYAKSILVISDRAVLVALADKLHNLRSMWSAPELITEINKRFYWELIQNLEKRLLSNAVAHLQHQEIVKLFFELW